MYSVIVGLALPLAFVVFLAHGLRDRRYWRNFAERLGYGSTLRAGSIWVHAASVGEVQAAATLISQLQARYPARPIVVTTVTPTGNERARTLFGTGVYVCYLPFDLQVFVRRFLDRIKPVVALILETELWPNLYHECAQRGIPLVVASARMTERSVRGYRKLLAPFRQALAKATLIAAQSEMDAQRFRLLGANPATTHVIGNLKFDMEVNADIVRRGSELRKQYASARPAWTAGSTHEGEEEAVLDAHRRVRRSHPHALLILAPRHPQRFQAVADWLAREGVHFAQRSRSRVATGDAEVLLLDTLGELVDFYAAADVAFVGGSLVPIGGHNLLEPAALGRPVLTGPHTSSIDAMARMLTEKGGLEVVVNSASLGVRVSALLGDATERARVGALARLAVETNRGALDRLFRLITPLVTR